MPATEVSDTHPASASQTAFPMLEPIVIVQIKPHDSVLGKPIGMPSK